jgi:mono/diheme cytochrome c family protein
MDKQLRSLLCGVGVVIILWFALTGVAAQSPSVHEPGMTPQERLARPPMSDPPTQIELGHAEYWMSCMVCHGDKGQGLTDEWRSVLDPADMNCWQSKCHAPNHPPEGFQIPRQAPLVIGPGALTGYQTATDLFEYLHVDMPWSFPGLFEDDVYWNLIAYLADVNDIELPKEPLSPDNGDQILMLPQLVQTHHTAIEVERIVAGAVVGLLFVATILYGLIRPL